MAKSKFPGIKVEDFNWGAIFTGSKDALIRAKLAPSAFKVGKEYTLPLDYSERYDKQAIATGFSGDAPQSWQATISSDTKGAREYSVYVEYDKRRDLDVRARAQDAIAALEVLRAFLLKVPPRPLSEAIPEVVNGK